MEPRTSVFQEPPPQFYNIDVDALFEKYSSNYTVLTDEIRNTIYDHIVDDLVKLTREGIIWFPYQKFYKGDPEQLFENLKHIDLETRVAPYRLRSYYPLYGTFLPPRFRGKPIVVSGTRLTYETADVLSDHFIEDVRMRAKRYDQKLSIEECWNTDSCLKEIFKTAIKQKFITPPSLRDSIYETVAETKIFNPTWAKALLKLVLLPVNGKTSDLSGKKWLDISSGWGDRLITAMAMDMDYTGFDPNTELMKGHSEMIRRFGNPSRHRVIYEPFELATIPNGPYDIVLSSTPYFNLEVYAPGQKGQSIVSYPDFNIWMVKFLFVALEKAWSNLKDYGYLVLHLGDAKTIVTAEAANIFIENFLPGSSWEGVIGLQGEAGFPRPVWVWKKLPRNTQRVLWQPPSGKDLLTSDKRTLYFTYPALHSELLRNYATKYAPYYPVRLSSAKAIIAHVSNKLPNIPPTEIQELLHDNLMISSLLEQEGIDGTISTLVKLLSSYPDISSREIKHRIGEMSPNYTQRINNSDDILDYVRSQFPTVHYSVINNILHDDLMLSSLVETLGIDRAKVWAVAMIKLSLQK